MYRLKRLIVTFVPPPILHFYHLLLAYLGAIVNGNPSRKLLVIGVTGTKGKSSTTEMVNAIFEEAGYKTALLNSIRIKVAEKSEPNTMRMSMPGRFYIQNFLSTAHRDGCTVAILEMTSEGARQNRHRAIALDALIFTNLAPEHIESHGSLRAYADAKFEIAQALVRSPKRPRTIVANADDPESSRYVTLSVERVLPFSLAANQSAVADEHGGHFRFDDVDIPVHLPGSFSLKNALAAATLANALGIRTSVIAQALDTLTHIPGRAERIEAGQDFAVVVDYAHTPDSLTALYDAYNSPSTTLGIKRKLICVLGATGGGRDLWKRPVMGTIADERCDQIILTNEDPYDEDPRSVLESVARGMKRQPEIIIDRREAIRRALSLANHGDVVLISGKGTDPTIQVAGGKAIPWSDAGVAREELTQLLGVQRVRDV
ncbi:MAG: UDP-N-acetylmuramyl-tripeptide synthetase [bacterium]|nr:UDP-N-acetylmuramyl-tripeptide synthetase [bacterium]